MKDAIIDQVEAVRRDNNSLWMELLRIALKHAPAETKETIRKIVTNDKKISNLLSLVSNGD